MGHLKILYKEKRTREMDIEDHHFNLSDEQTKMVYSLSKVGYLLHCVRTCDDESRLAIMTRGDTIAAINEDGSIVDSNDIRIRNLQKAAC